MRRGNSYRIFIGKEAAFNSGGTEALGANAFTNLKVWHNPIDIAFAPEALETGFKTNSAMPDACQTAQGYETGSVTISGTLTDEHEILLSACTHDASSPYAWTAKPTAGSFVIMRVWDDAAATPYTVDKLTGCRLESVTFTASSGGLLNFDAVFTPAGYLPKEEQAITGTDPGKLCHEPFNFGRVTYDGDYGSTETLKSFSIMLGTEYAENAAAYQNSNTRLADPILNYMGELQIATNHVETNAADLNNAGVNSNTIGTATIEFINNNKTWTFVLPYTVTALSLPDPGNQMFEISATGRIVYDGDTPQAPTITVAATA